MVKEIGVDRHCHIPILRTACCTYHTYLNILVTNRYRSTPIPSYCKNLSEPIGQEIGIHRHVHPPIAAGNMHRYGLPQAIDIPICYSIGYCPGCNDENVRAGPAKIRIKFPKVLAPERIGLENWNY